MCFFGSANYGKCCCCIPLGVSGTITTILLLFSGALTVCKFSQTPIEEVGGLASSALFTFATLLSFVCFYCGTGASGFAYFASQFSAVVVTFQIILQWIIWCRSLIKTGDILIGTKMAFIITGIWVVTLIINVFSISIFRSSWEIKVQGGSPWQLKNAKEVRLKNLEKAVGV
ncbi:hypothetical protein RS030_263667 [Cryptosporidium xiaoi]|uniref:Transmembrane protein n=1 Tax=Cryptosporidium xiaoi TaxID=659607 RepID=A0AAV9XWS8_9CRYT